MLLQCKRPKEAFILTLLVAGALLSGCDVINLLLFRRQISRQPPSYARVEGGAVVDICFSEPVLLEGSLVSMGIPLEKESGSIAVARYRLRVNSYSEPEFFIKFSFRDSRLERISIPAFVPELLGERNILAYFKLMSGVRTASDDFDDISSESIGNVLARYGKSIGRLERNVDIELTPVIGTGKKLSIHLSRQDEATPFSKMVLSL